MLGPLTRTAMSTVASSDIDTVPRMVDEAACDICGGARFVRVTSDPDDPQFGQPVPCACALHEDGKTRRQRLLRYSRLGPLQRMSFDALITGGRSTEPAAQSRYREAVEVVERFAEHPEGWLVLTGPHGVGKTHLAAAVANRLIDRGEPALFLSVADLLDELRGSYDEGADLGYEKLLAQLRDAPVLVLDDLDGYSETAWAREKFVQLVTHRFNLMLPTVFTSVRTPVDIDPRLASRLTDPAVAQLLELGLDAAPRFFSIGAMGEPELTRFQFENFDPTGRGLRGESRRNLEGAFRLARHWADQPDGWLVFLGSNGCGKTHLAAAITGYRLEQGDKVAFANVPDLLDELRATFAPGSPERFDRRFRRLLEAPLLVLDDLGAQQASAWAGEKLYQILNHRHLQRTPTIVTTNRELKDMEPRIASRLADLQTSTVYQFTAPDYRTGGAT